MRSTQSGLAGALGPFLLLLSACGNGDGDSPKLQSPRSEPPGEVPSVTISADPDRVASGQSSSVAWSAANAESCDASGGWSGSKPTSGTESTGPLTSTTAYTLTCTGSGGTVTESASVTVGEPDPGSIFPLRVDSGERYLIDARGSPFFINGDAPWSLTVQLTREESEAYLEDRRSKGFNAVLVNLIEHHFAANPPNNAYGEAPFTVPGDFATPNEAYFAHAEYVISRAAEKGILVMLTPAYIGYQGGDQGWYQEMAHNGETALRAYGRYVANRFRAHDNIVWVQGGDYNPPERSLVDAVADGIRDVDTRWLQTFHGARGTAALEFLGPTTTWLTLNNIYTDENGVVASAFQEYTRSDMPFFLLEARYEGEGGAGGRVVRAQAYQAALSGASGHVMGNRPVWEFTSGWQEALDSPGARSLAHLRALFESLEWWTLEPDIDGEILTAGVGSDLSRAAFALAGDGSFALGYTPDVRDLTVNLVGFAGPDVRARWYDPTNGSYAAISGSPFAASGSVTLTPPGVNSAGDPDWLLLLQSEP